MDVGVSYPFEVLMRLLILLENKGVITEDEKYAVAQVRKIVKEEHESS